LQMAMGLIHSPKILFLDEPTLGLDIQTRTKVWEYIKKLNEGGLSVFMTTHYLEEADGLCDRVAIIDHGTIRVMDTPARLKERIGGSMLVFEVNNGEIDLSESLQKIPGVSEITRNGRSYKLKLPSTEDALPAIVSVVTSCGMKISQISFLKPSLDEVFLEVTGRTMREEEGAQESWIQNVNMGRSTN
jgi:ABC-2 type transport system ATP-binding protein